MKPAHSGHYTSVVESGPEVPWNDPVSCWDLAKSRSRYALRFLLSSGHREDRKRYENPSVVRVDTRAAPTVQKLYNIACFAVFVPYGSQPRRYPPLCESGGTGRRARLRI